MGWSHPRAYRSLVRSQQRPLYFEPLEDRHLLAQLALPIQLWTIDGNNKGTKIEPDPVTNRFVVAKDSSFFIQVLADDLRPQATQQGIISLPLDLKWATLNTGLIRFVDPPPPLFPVPIDITNPIVTSRFPLQRFVTSFDPNSEANDLRGAAIPNLPNSGQPIDDPACVPGGFDQCREFSLLRFTATANGDARFTAQLAGSMSFADADALENNPIGEAIITVVPASSLSGYVYLDNDFDGDRDTDPVTGAPVELGIPNITISLLRQNDAAVLQTFTTGADGFFHFEGMQPGVYRLREEPEPPCFLDGQETVGIVLPGGFTRGIAGNDEITNIELRPGENGIDYLFGERLSPACINKRMFLTSSRPAREVVAQLAGVPATTVQGTANADNINIQKTGNVISVTVNNGPVQQFNTTQVKLVTVDAGGGADVVTINGTDVNELACLEPTYATLRRDDVPLIDPLGYGVEVHNAENVTVDVLSQQNDLAVLRDSPGNDALVAGGNSAALRKTATLNWANGLTGTVRNFGTVRSISVAGGADTSKEDLHDYVLQLLGNWQPI